MTLTISSTRRLLRPGEKSELADALGDSPETALPVHLLRKGNGQVYMAGELPDFQAVIIEDYSVGPELMAFGSDTYSLWRLLEGIDGWDAVNVPGSIGRELADIIREEIRVPIRLVDDVYQVPAGPIPLFYNDEVRMLTHRDIELLEATPDAIRDCFDDDLEVVLDEELLAGAVLPGAGIVAIGSTYGMQEKYVDIAISTLEAYRCRGYARAAASLVASATHQAGRTPIWSCAPTNLGSLQVARHLGFREVSRRANIVLDAA
jgi:hypothetical protein